ncbi:hypothetical protein MRX96_051078 [Rhipicephalus microplus]
MDSGLTKFAAEMAPAVHHAAQVARAVDVYQLIAKDVCSHWFDEANGLFAVLLPNESGPLSSCLGGVNRTCSDR